MARGILDFLHVARRYLAGQFHQIARHVPLAVTLTGLLAFVGSVAVGLVAGIPVPSVHDEFSYLLAADTFAHGRITNPTHPMWVHFESIHIIHQPSYMSKYPPAQGLMLAAGQVIAGHAIVGVWLSMGLMCASICWMLYAWMPARWAFLGGLLAVINPMIGVSGSWAQSYWGGAIATTGGALILGGIRRVMHHPSSASALIIGLGLAMLAFSRPYEGLIFSLPLGVILLKWLPSTKAPKIALSLRKIIAPITLMVILTGIAMGFYNFRVTGDMFRLPYQVHAESYGQAPLFLLQKETPQLSYRHKVLQDFHEMYELDFYKNQRSMPFLIILRSAFLILLAAFHSVNILAIPLIGTLTFLAPWSLRNEWAFRALLVYLFSVGGLIVTTYVSVVYLAPVIALNYYFVVNAMRLWCFRNRKMGQLMSWMVPLLATLALAMSLGGRLLQYDASAWSEQRANILRQLSNQKGKHLIIVSYGPHHSVHEEWVYNEASIDDAKIIWARQMNPVDDCRLVNYFSDRQTWTLDINDKPTPPALKLFLRSMCRNHSST
jgi:hypothetical protein